MATLPLLSDDGAGRIINIAGQTARTLIPKVGVTGVTNAAVIALSSYLASEGAARNVLVNAIRYGRMHRCRSYKSLSPRASTHSRSEP